MGLITKLVDQCLHAPMEGRRDKLVVRWCSGTDGGTRWLFDGVKGQVGRLSDGVEGQVGRLSGGVEGQVGRPVVLWVWLQS